MFYSPLRYPGGKAKLADFMQLMIEKLNHKLGVYIEPFAGGAGIALNLLFNDYVSHIVINDYDKAIASFWKALLSENDRFIDAIMSVPLTVDEWQHQKTIIDSAKQYSFELGFATFYLNRTNRSGILKGGLIGGKEQVSDWKMDARFNRENLSEKVRLIGSRKKDITIYNKDVSTFINTFLPKYSDNALVYFDPPYFYKGKQLYMNYFTLKDHKRIETLVRNNLKSDWIITYDNAPAIRNIYQNYPMKKYELNYSIGEKRKSDEIMIMPDECFFPNQTELKLKKINIKLEEI